MSDTIAEKRPRGRPAKEKPVESPSRKESRKRKLNDEESDSVNETNNDSQTGSHDESIVKRARGRPVKNKKDKRLKSVKVGRTKKSHAVQMHEENDSDNESVNSRSAKKPKATNNESPTKKPRGRPKKPLKGFQLHSHKAGRKKKIHTEELPVKNDSNGNESDDNDDTSSMNDTYAEKANTTNDESLSKKARGRPKKPLKGFQLNVNKAGRKKKHDTEELSAKIEPNGNESDNNETDDCPS